MGPLILWRAGPPFVPDQMRCDGPRSIAIWNASNLIARPALPISAFSTNGAGLKAEGVAHDRPPLLFHRLTSRQPLALVRSPSFQGHLLPTDTEFTGSCYICLVNLLGP